MRGEKMKGILFVKKRRLSSYLVPVIVVLAVLVCSSTTALAVPQPPHQFYGDVTVNGQPAAAGVEIVTKIDGIVYASTMTDANGQYGYDPLFTVPADDSDTTEKEGGVEDEIVEFWVFDQLAGSKEFHTLWVERFDLSVTTSSVEEYLLTGEVKLQGGERPGESYNLPLTLNLYDPGVVLCSDNILSEEPLYSFTAGDGLSITGTDSETQTVYFQSTLPGGAYHMCLSNTYTLHNVICNYVIAQNGQHLNMETLLFGNANCDARVSGGDFAMLLNDYWEQEGDPAWNNGRCDFDGNGQVTGLDYSIMAFNYSASSPVICSE